MSEDKTPTGRDAGNPYHDFEITDPRAMRALSHPVRLRILDQLKRYGPATATSLSPIVGASPSVTSWHLRHLAEFGLVRDADVVADGRRRWWEAVARGYRFAVPDNEAGRAASRLLSSQMFAQYEQLPRHWIDQVAPRLSGPWQRLGGLANTRVALTPDELDQVENAIEELLTPYVLRQDTDGVPANARSVRLMRYALPQGDVPEQEASASPRSNRPVPGRSGSAHPPTGP